MLLVKIKAMEQEIMFPNPLTPPFDEPTFPNAISENDLRDVILGCIAILQHNTAALQEQQNQKLWSDLLNALVLPLNKYQEVTHQLLPPKQNDRRIINGVSRQVALRARPPPDTSSRPIEKRQRVKRGLTLLIKEVINNMMNHVKFDAILETIHKNHAHEKFGEFQAIFMSLLDVTTYELSKLSMCYNLLKEDAYKEEVVLFILRNRPLNPEHVKLGVVAPPQTPVERTFGRTPQYTKWTPKHGLSVTVDERRTGKRKTRTFYEDEPPDFLRILDILKQSRSMDIERKLEAGQLLVPELPYNKTEHISLAPLRETNRAVQIQFAKKKSSRSLKIDRTLLAKGEVSVDDSKMFG